MPKKMEYKSSVFSMLLENPENALEVYNALNGSDYKNPGLVEMNRLEVGLVLTVRNEAIDQAINECIGENVLKDFLVERGNEVRQVAALDYTWEAREGMIRKEEYEEGYKAGEEEGYKAGEIEGEKRGRKDSKIEGILICLEKFAPIPDALVKEISSVSDESVLSEIIRLAVGSNSLEEFKVELVHRKISN